MDDREILQQIRAYKEWMASPVSRPIDTNQDVFNYIEDNGFIHRHNLPDKHRIAMMMAFEFFNMINQGRVSCDSQCPHGGSWHEYYKQFALRALDRAGGMWRD